MRQPEREQRVGDRPGLIAFRWPALDQRRARCEIESGPDNQDAANTALGVERFQDSQPRIDDVASFDRRIGTESAGAIQVSDGRRARTAGNKLLLGTRTSSRDDIR